MRSTRKQQGTSQMTQGASALGNPYLFVGRRFDGRTGVYYYRNRYFEPRSGRFGSRDPIGYHDSLSLYAYIQNNVVNALDPFGQIKVAVNVTPKWDSISGTGKVKINAELRSGLRGSTSIWPAVAKMWSRHKSFNSKPDDIKNAAVLITKIKCRIKKEGNCYYAYDNSIQLRIRPYIRYLKGSREVAIHEATHARQIGDKIKSAVSGMKRIVTAPGSKQSVIIQCKKQVANEAEKLILIAINDWIKDTSSIHALEAGAGQKDPDKLYRDQDVEKEAQKQAKTGEFPKGVTIPKKIHKLPKKDG